MGDRERHRQEENVFTKTSLPRFAFLPTWTTNQVNKVVIRQENVVHPSNTLTLAGWTSHFKEFLFTALNSSYLNVSIVTGKKLVWLRHPAVLLSKSGRRVTKQALCLVHLFGSLDGISLSSEVAQIWLVDSNFCWSPENSCRGWGRAKVTGNRVTGESFTHSGLDSQSGRKVFSAFLKSDLNCSCLLDEWITIFFSNYCKTKMLFLIFAKHKETNNNKNNNKSVRTALMSVLLKAVDSPHPSLLPNGGGWEEGVPVLPRLPYCNDVVLWQILSKSCSLLLMDILYTQNISFTYIEVWFLCLKKNIP